MITQKSCNAILREYPEYISKEQMCKLCHISKKTCLRLLEAGLVPCIDTGRTTHRFKIATKDVVRYLRDREIHPGRYAPPMKDTSTCRQTIEEYTPEQLQTIRSFYEDKLVKYPDVMIVAQISAFTGYGASSVIRWCGKKELRAFLIKDQYRVPKEYLLDFLLTDRFMRIAVKSNQHRFLDDEIATLVDPSSD